jgi:hypothetical protein
MSANPPASAPMNRLPEVPRSLDEPVFVAQYMDLTHCADARARSVYLMLDALIDAPAAADGSANAEPPEWHRRR